MGAPLNREAPTSPSAAGRGVVTCHIEDCTYTDGPRGFAISDLVPSTDRGIIIVAVGPYTKVYVSEHFVTFDPWCLSMESMRRLLGHPKRWPHSVHYALSAEERALSSWMTRRDLDRYAP